MPEELKERKNGSELACGCPLANPSRHPSHSAARSGSLPLMSTLVRPRPQDRGGGLTSLTPQSHDWLHVRGVILLYKRQRLRASANPFLPPVL